MSLAGLLLRGFGGNASVSLDTPTLSVADDADGTGGTATISGATSGTTNTVYYLSRSSLGSAWTSAGSRSGNGTLAVNVAVGRYWAYATSTLSGVYAVSSVVAFSATSGDESIYENILTEVAADIVDLSLSGITTSVDIQKVPRKKSLASLSLPCCIVAPWGRKTVRGAGSPNTRDDIEYPVAVITIQASNEDQDTSRDRAERWHESILDAFIHQRLFTDDDADVWTCMASPTEVFDPAAFGAGYDVGGMILRFVARQ